MGSGKFVIFEKEFWVFARDYLVLNKEKATFHHSRWVIGLVIGLVKALGMPEPPLFERVSQSPAGSRFKNDQRRSTVIQDLAIEHSPHELFDPHRILIVSIFAQSVSITSGDENPRRTLGDYSKPSHEGYRNTIEIPDRNNVVPLRSDTIGWCKTDAHFTDFVAHHGIDLWLQVQIFYDHIDLDLKKIVDYAAGGQLRRIGPEKAWTTIEELARYKEEG
ncbi:hypothetical protein Tco_0116733 [Tanacetum coccineum]